MVKRNILRQNRHPAGILHVRLVLSALAFVVLVIAIIAVLSNGTTSDQTETGSNTVHASTTTSNPTTSNNSYAVLPPATVQPRVPECSQQISYSSNGDSGPISCGNGYVNVLEWNALSALEPKVMALGYNPSLAQVQAALCSDASDSSSDATTKNSNVIEITTYQISALYYGWTFSPSPTAILTSNNC